MDRLPLTGVRVLDLTRVLSGPFCSAILGDMGADIIKIEPPGGDPVRPQGAKPNGFSFYFANFNRNKRSVVLDLYTEDGKAALRKMLAQADVILDNFRPGTLAKMGFDAATLKQINPGLVSANLNGYGSTGPYTNRPAFDFVVQAMSGFMSVTGAEGEPPMRTGLPITDLVAGLYTATGILAALRHRDQTGQGQAVEVAMMNGIISMFAYLATEYFATGDIPPRTGNDHPLIAPYGLYQTADGEIAVAPSNDAILGKFLGAIGLSDILKESAYETNEKRFGQRPALKRLIEARLADHGQDHWISVLNGAGVPCGKVQDFAQVFADPQVQAQEMAIDIAHPGHGMVRMLGFPIKFAETPCQARYPAPQLGAHSAEVLAEFGFSADEIAKVTGEQ